MADIYDRSRALAIRMLGLRGNGGKSATMVLVKTATPEYEPGQPPAEPVETRSTGSAVRSRYDSQDIDGTVVLRNDVKFLVSPVTAEGADLPPPTTGDTIEFDNTAYRVMGVQAWDYVGLQIGFIVQGRE